MRIPHLAKKLFIFASVACALCSFLGAIAVAQGNWADEISNSLVVYKGLYPTSNFEPYEQQMMRVKEALGKGDKKAVRTGMTKWFKMLKKRAHGIDGMAADELFNFAVMVTPVQKYNIRIPAR